MDHGFRQSVRRHLVVELGDRDGSVVPGRSEALDNRAVARCDPPDTDPREGVRFRHRARDDGLLVAHGEHGGREFGVGGRYGVEERPIDFIGEDEDVPLAGEVHEALQDRFGNRGAGGVVWIIDDNHLGVLLDQALEVVQIWDELLLPPQLPSRDLRAQTLWDRVQLLVRGVHTDNMISGPN